MSHLTSRLLLDEATGNSSILSSEAQELSKVVRNVSRPLTERVTHFEDIINLEVGDTSLSRARNIEREIGLRQVYLKFEGGNPTGTQKDRIAFAQCLDALRRGYDTVTVATCGNYGAAVSLAASYAGLKCVICIPAGYHTARIAEMEKMGADIARVPGSYEDTVRHSQEMARRSDWYDANPGGQNTPLQLQAYGEIAFEIYDQLRDAPKAIAIPASNGTLLAGVYRGFVSLYKRGKTSRIPKIIGASSTNKNPIVASWKKDLDHCIDLDPEKIKETKFNEPLINWHSFDGQEALDAIYHSQGFAEWATDKQLLAHSRLLREKEGLEVLPASTAGLVAFRKWQELSQPEGDRFVILLTGRK